MCSRIFLPAEFRCFYAFSGEVMTSAVPTAFVRLPEEDMEAAESSPNRNGETEQARTAAR